MVQWRIVHGAIATYRHVAHLDPSTGLGCPFCSEVESLSHWFLHCQRLEELFSLVGRWFQGLGERFSFEIHSEKEICVCSAKLPVRKGKVGSVENQE